MITNKGIELMEKYGGSFVKALAKCWYKADPINKKKLEDNFKYFEEYEQQAIRRNKEETIKKIEAQAKFCKDKDYPNFAPSDGRCYSCGRPIYSQITLEKATNTHIQHCPFCHRSYCD